jgi:hypothetical protein
MGKRFWFSKANHFVEKGKPANALGRETPPDHSNLYQIQSRII